MRIIVSLLVLLVSQTASLAQSKPGPGEVQASQGLPAALADVGIEQHLDEMVPGDLVFRDHADREVRLGDFFGGKPIILVLAYYRCPMLCTQVLNGLADRLRALRIEPGKDFTVLTLSFDPSDTPTMAAAKRQSYLDYYGRPEADAGWHFLTGNQDSINRLTQAVGFKYRIDPARNEFAHASGIILLTPQGKIARYYMGLSYSPRDLQLGLVESAAGKIGSPVDQLMLYCFQFDGASGKYTLAIMRLVRVAGIVTVVAMVGFFVLARRREKHKTPGPVMSVTERKVTSPLASLWGERGRG